MQNKYCASFVRRSIGNIHKVPNASVAMYAWKLIPWHHGKCVSIFTHVSSARLHRQPIGLQFAWQSTHQFEFVQHSRRLDVFTLLKIVHTDMEHKTNEIVRMQMMLNRTRLLTVGVVSIQIVQISTVPWMKQNQFKSIYRTLQIYANVSVARESLATELNYYFFAKFTHLTGKIRANINVVTSDLRTNKQTNWRLEIRRKKNIFLICEKCIIRRSVFGSHFLDLAIFIAFSTNANYLFTNAAVIYGNIKIQLQS